jgi:hypothetical protein
MISNAACFRPQNNFVKMLAIRDFSGIDRDRLHK